MQEIEQRDRDLLAALQADLPLVSTPFAVIGQMIDMSEKEVLKRIERLRREGIVRHLAGQFDPRALGYRSCLAAARVAEDRVDEAAAVINAHPGVTQNYLRNGDLNLWFTIAVAPTSQLGLEKSIDVLAAEAGCETVRPLPTLRLFKSTAPDGHEQHSGDDVQDDHYVPLTSAEMVCVRALQRELPLQPRPFDALARNSGTTPEELLATARSLLKRAQMRRFGAVIQTRRGGFSASAMGVWIVPETRIEECGTKMSENRAVSHCYLRPVYEDWPYNIYTTVHGRTIEECESIINDLAADTGVLEKRTLYPVREFKKSRVTLFSPELDEWEAARAARRTASAAS